MEGGQRESVPGTGRQDPEADGNVRPLRDGPFVSVPMFFLSLDLTVRQTIVWAHPAGNLIRRNPAPLAPAAGIRQLRTGQSSKKVTAWPA